MNALLYKAPPMKGPGPRNPWRNIRGNAATFWPSGDGGLRPGAVFDSRTGQRYRVAPGGNFVRVLP